MARIELDHVTKRYPGGVPAVNDLTLDIPDGDFMVFVGPSGSGKSTALRMIASRSTPTAPWPAAPAVPRPCSSTDDSTSPATTNRPWARPWPPPASGGDMASVRLEGWTCD